jgi:hypothetical protein
VARRSGRPRRRGAHEVSRPDEDSRFSRNTVQYEGALLNDIVGLIDDLEGL